MTVCKPRASGTGSHRCISSMLPVSSAWGERIHSFSGLELHIFLHILGHTSANPKKQLEQLTDESESKSAGLKWPMRVQVPPPAPHFAGAVSLSGIQVRASSPHFAQTEIAGLHSSALPIRVCPSAFAPFSNFCALAVASRPRASVKQRSHWDVCEESSQLFALAKRPVESGGP